MTEPMHHQLTLFASESEAHPTPGPEALGASILAWPRATPCKGCGHFLNWHVYDIGCVIRTCACPRFQWPFPPPTHLAKGIDAEDCPACRAGNPRFPPYCPGP
ncbi:hypothetical protein Sfulv_18360 [Streptomyces fulvorobeus]|uniref:Uncharacterized protein n=1 Tax=Streptomyces fulvorobeus TaxID=284028 RepID=A0A7J0C3D1_9ACTN|nr:hypothetical protein [Streptomyces fulvorobeus]GFM97025.1 hypothetical protein Sfulv_18360 [Streptomyces fulvorobeus]